MSIICEHFGFDVKSAEEAIKQNNKENYQSFIELIDFLNISPGAKQTEIIITFTVNDIWVEGDDEQ